MINAGRRRALPMDVASPAWPTTAVGTARPEATWVGPALDHRVGVDAADPAEAAVARESVRIAFVAALQHLPARQRAVLILRDVLRWRADEVGTLLEMTTTAVHSMLRRARSALADARAGRTAPLLPPEEARAVVDRYVDAFDRVDMGLLVRLLRDDATFDMPPYLLWLDGAEAIAAWFAERLDPCHPHLYRPLTVNGTAGLAMYRSPGPGQAPVPFGIEVVEVAEDGIVAVHAYLDPALFPLFGVPTTAPA
jgi:RNA polymerase sigma-70 factor (ECF subfamily)